MGHDSIGRAAAISALAWGVVFAASACAGRQAAGTNVVVDRSDRLGRAAAERAAHELSCPRQSLNVRAMGAGAYEVHGCGSRRTYTCISQRRAVVCTPDDAITVDGGRQSTWSSERVRAALRGLRDEVAACAAPEHQPVRVLVGFSRMGRARVERWQSPLSEEERGCVERTLERVDLEGEVHRTLSVLVSFDASHEAEVSESEPSAEPNAPEAPAAPPSGEHAQAVRDALDARAEAILACVDESALAVAVSWSATTTTVALRGAMHGTDVEGCVVSLTTDLPRAPSGEPDGSVLHVVHRAASR